MPMTQKHRQAFTEHELDTIRSLLREVRASERDRQKALRGQLRRMGFYITDYATDQAGFTASDVDRLIARGTITVLASINYSKRREPGTETTRDASATVPPSGGTGHRVTVEWMGTLVETLEDLLEPGLRAVTIGVNPAPTSVAAGHYYQGRLGKQFFSRLTHAGVVDLGHADWEDDRAFEQGIGFTDIVKRPTGRADEVTGEELDYGRSLLFEKLHSNKPKLLVFTFKKSAESLFGSFEGSGLLPRLTLDGTPVFVMPGPYAARDIVRGKLGELRSVLGGK